MNVADLCAGYGGLTLGLGLAPTWCAEIDRHAAAAYAYRHPGVDNVGDLTALSDWPDADVVVAGFPCQPVSSAGRRKGTDDDRWIWPHIARCVRGVRPSWLVLENVRGLLTANGGRALAEVMHDLAVMGFDAAWGVVRASDAGACHRRERWFCIARAGDADGLAWPTADARGWRPGPMARPGEIERAIGSDGGALLPTPTSTYPGGSPERYRERLSEHDGRGGEFVSLNHAVELIATPTTSDAKGAVPGHGGTTAEDVMALVKTLPTPTVGDSKAARNSTAVRHRTPPTGVHDGDTLTDLVDKLAPAARQWDIFECWTLPMWRQYGPAIARHEAMLGRPAPSPVIDNPRARTGVSLSPAFVEWMMCLPAGWVTDVPDLPRTAQLRLLGNGVVPPQAALAASMLAPALDRQAVQREPARPLAPDAARPFPQRAATSWRCPYCRRGYVPAIGYRPDAATCPACGADLEGDRP